MVSPGSRGAAKLLYSRRPNRGLNSRPDPGRRQFRYRFPKSAQLRLSGNDFSGILFLLRRLGYSVPRGVAIEINFETLAAPVLEPVQADLCVAVHCPRDLTRGKGGVKAAAARPGELDLLLSLGLSLGDQSAEAKYPEKSLPDNRS